MVQNRQGEIAAGSCCSDGNLGRKNDGYQPIVHPYIRKDQFSKAKKEPRTQGTMGWSW